MAETHKQNFIFSSYLQLFFYEGLTVFLPYLVIKIESSQPVPMEPSQIPYFLWVQVLGLIGLLIMDSYSIRSTFVDRVRKIITLVVSIIGCIIVIVLLILVWNGWDNTNIYVSYCCASILVCFEILGLVFCTERSRTL